MDQAISSQEAASRPGQPARLVAAAGAAHRLQALDVLRGFVIALMAVDHSSGEFNAGRVMADSAFLFKPGTALDPVQFLTRWITHLCAPTFVFLAGASIYLSTVRRKRRGEGAFAIDRHLFTRGLVIVAFEVVPSYFWMDRGRFLFQVLYAIGTSFILMVPLRRLPVPALLLIAGAIICFGEAVTGLSGWGPPDKTPIVAALLLVPGPHGHLIIAYPTLYWLAIMLLGYGFGSFVDRGMDAKALRALLAKASLSLFAVFAVVRGVNGYGNMLLVRNGNSLVEWLHVSKYPPSVSFVTLELGISAALLWFIVGMVERAPLGEKNVFVVIGRTPMFFYLLHIPLLVFAAEALGVAHRLGVGAAFGFAALVTVVLYPACLFYGRYKTLHPRGVLEYL